MDNDFTMVNNQVRNVNFGMTLSAGNNACNISVALCGVNVDGWVGEGRRYWIANNLFTIRDAFASPIGAPQNLGVNGIQLAGGNTDIVLDHNTIWYFSPSGTPNIAGNHGLNWNVVGGGVPEPINWTVLITGQPACLGTNYTVGDKLTTTAGTYCSTSPTFTVSAIGAGGWVSQATLTTPGNAMGVGCVTPGAGTVTVNATTLGQ